MSRPEGVAVGSDGSVYVACCGVGRIAKFSRDGKLITSWDADGTSHCRGIGKFAGPSDMTLDPSGNLYVVDSYNLRIIKYDPEGRYLTKWSFPSYKNGSYIASDRLGRIYLTLCKENSVYIYSTDGEFLSKLAVDEPYGIAVDTEGNLFVSSMKMAYAPTSKPHFPPGIWGSIYRAAYWYNSLRSKNHGQQLGPEKRLMKFTPS
jgi:sugar lactone lactonase YvrE